MMSRTFTFKQFTLHDDRCAMKIGTDGVLLGAWANGGQRILDIGSGSGLIVLMMAQRYLDAHIDGVEIDSEAARQATENVNDSPFSSRVQIIEMPFQQFQPEKPYDAIVSNPPFFLSSADYSNTSRAVARHAETSFFKEFFRFAKDWLSADGQASIVIPCESIEPISAEAYLLGFFLARRVFIRTKATKPIERCLVAFSKRRTAPPSLTEETLLTPDGEKSAWNIHLTDRTLL